MIHRVAMCTCGHELHPAGPCSTCGCEKASKRGSPIAGQSGGISADVLNDLRRTAHTMELAATVIHGHAKNILAALARIEHGSRRRSLGHLPAPPTNGLMNGHSAPRRPVVPSSHAGHAGLSRCELRLLTVLSQRRGMQTTRGQLAVMAGYSPTSGGFAEAMTTLRAAGLVTGFSITPAGLEVAPTEKIPTGKDLLDFWKPKLNKCEQRLVEVLWNHRQTSTILSRTELAEVAGYSPTSGGYASALTRLRTFELLDRQSIRLTSIITEARP